MTSLRTRVRAALPTPCRRLVGRALRRGRQLKGLPASRHRRGVVLMLHVGRCGSTVLADMLGRHPEICWDGKLPRFGRALHGADAMRRMDHLTWIRRQYAISGRRYYGFEFKMMDYQYPAILGTTGTEFVEAGESLDITHYILLQRRNAVHQLVSDGTSRARRSWHARDHGDLANPRIRIDLEKVTALEAPGLPLLDHLEDLDRVHLAMRRALRDRRLLELEYEKDILESGPEAAFGKVCDFLEVTRIDAKPSYRKINPTRPEECVENWTELQSALRGTRFEWMVEPVPIVSHTVEASPGPGASHGDRSALIEGAGDSRRAQRTAGRIRLQ